MVRSLSVFVVSMLAMVPVARAESSILARGVLDGMKPEVGGLITLKLDRSAIRLDRGVWGQEKEEAKEDANNNVPLKGNAAVQLQLRARLKQTPAENAFRRLQSAIQASQTSGMTSNNTRSVSFASPSLSGKLETNDSLVTIRLYEPLEPSRSVEVIDEPNGMFRLLVAGSDSDLVLISQSPGGATSVACVVGEKQLVASGKSFADVFSKNREIFEKTIFPALSHMGIGLSLSANTPQVRGAVVAMLTPLTDEEKQTADKLIADLASADFAQREVARERLAAGMDRYRPIIEKIEREGLSADVRFTLDQLLSGADADPTRKLVTEMKLLDDPKFLIGILDTLEPPDRKIVTAHLAKLTGQSLGDDVGAWQKWAEQN